MLSSCNVIIVFSLDGSSRYTTLRNLFDHVVTASIIDDNCVDKHNWKRFGSSAGTIMWLTGQCRFSKDWIAWRYLIICESTICIKISSVSSLRFSKLDIGCLINTASRDLHCSYYCRGECLRMMTGRVSMANVGVDVPATVQRGHTQYRYAARYYTHM